jgi:hypothetical protein
MLEFRQEAEERPLMTPIERAAGAMAAQAYVDNFMGSAAERRGDVPGSFERFYPDPL